MLGKLDDISFIVKALIVSYFLVVKWLFTVYVDLYKTTLNDVNFDEDDPGSITYVRLLAWRNRFGK